jgi:hypothetical protein
LQSPLLVGKHGEYAPVFHVISNPAYHQPTYIFGVLNHLKPLLVKYGEIYRQYTMFVGDDIFLLIYDYIYIHIYIYYA